MSEDIFHWVYVSRVAEALDPQELDSLLCGVQKKNESRGISGLLLPIDNRFIHILEGAREEIARVSKTIVRDARHKDQASSRLCRMENGICPAKRWGAFRTLAAFVGRFIFYCRTQQPRG